MPVCGLPYSYNGENIKLNRTIRTAQNLTTTMNQIVYVYIYIKFSNVRFEVLKAVAIKNNTIWDVFCCFSAYATYMTLKMAAVNPSETFTNFHQTVRRVIYPKRQYSSCSFDGRGAYSTTLLVATLTSNDGRHVRLIRNYLE
jgi:hypothetical protein